MALGLTITMNLLKAALFTLIAFALLLVASAVAAKADLVFGLEKFQSPIAAAVGASFLLLGFILRFWATMLFYQNRLKVISPKPQQTLLTSGPYKFSRNPLYLGIIFILFGAVLLLGSFSAVLFSFVVFGLLDWWTRIEENQLVVTFGKGYLDFKSSVRRWL